MLGKIKDLGAVGYVADKEPTDIPENGWDFLQNIRCEDRSIANFPGHDSLGAISVQAETITSVKSSQRTYLVYAGGTDIYSYSAGVETDIGGYTYSSGGEWDSCVLGGVAILNNGVDNPQYWGGSGTALRLPYDSTDENNICYWDTLDTPMTARIIRSFKFHLFAFDIEDCSGRNRRRVWWSHPAAPGTLPITWDINKADFDARDTELTETSGYILDALQLRDTLQIYLDDAIYAVTFTGRPDRQIFNFRLVTTAYGIYARGCVCDFGGLHFLVSDGDILLYDGTNFKSIADERVKNLFFNGVNRSFYFRSFCVYYHRTKEVWLCYPEGDSVNCNKALVWDSEENTWSQTDIPEANCGTFAIVDRETQYGWGTQAQLNALGTGKIALPYDTWADWGVSPASPLWTRWGQPIDNAPIYDSLVLAGTSELFEADQGNTADGVVRECIARRTHLDIGDKADYHMVTSVYPYATGDAFQVRIGTMDVVNGSITWSPYQTFTPGTSQKLFFRHTGRLHAVEFYSNADVAWKVSSYEFDYVPVGRR